MIITKDIYDDRLSELEDLIEIYHLEIMSNYYIELANECGSEYAVEMLLRDLPDGFTRGRYNLRDINRRLDYVDNSGNT